MDMVEADHGDLIDALLRFPHGDEILVEVLKAHSFKQFILGIEKVVGRQWIYVHASQLKILHECASSKALRKLIVEKSQKVARTESPEQ